jgi:NADPH-dependent 2,4-dienoyl-CoA reductase/sulfur reductase-like enzyme
VTGATVVVGAALAGVRTVQALRRKGYDAPIAMLGAESHAPYDRPPLSKEFLLGKLGEDDLRLVDDGALEALDVQLLGAMHATGLDLDRREVVADRERIPFETLIIATGSNPRLLPGTHDRAGVHPLRTLDDAVAIRAAFAAEARVAVVGGGFIGAEVASSARQLGLDVTIVDPLPALMIRGVGPVVGTALANRHRDNGVHMKLGRCVSRVEGTDRVERLVLDDGTSLDVDLVVVGIGVDPAVEWLAGSGLDVAGGIACDASLRVADGIYAVGDVARFAGPGGQRRLEHWTNAGDQAAVLADVLTGAAATYAPVPYVWSDQLGTRLQVWGDVRPEDELHWHLGDPDSAEFVVASGGDGAMRGVVALGARREAMQTQRMLYAGASWPPGRGPVARSG